MEGECEKLDEIGKDYTIHNEADLITGMMKQLVIPIRRYLEWKGTSKTC
jgi:hypothetical protein